MIKRKVIEIDRDKCDGCGLCTEACATVAIMTVPCCAGLYNIVEKAVELSGAKINIKKTVIGLDGEIIS